MEHSRVNVEAIYVFHALLRSPSIKDYVHHFCRYSLFSHDVKQRLSCKIHLYSNIQALKIHLYSNIQALKIHL